jgi:hypothetical protein
MRTRRDDRTVWLALGLVSLSLVLYALNLAVFRDARDLFFYTLLDLAFIPLEVLIVGVVINRLLQLREKRALLNKLNMVIGAFFSEVGTELIRRLNGFDTDFDAIRGSLLFTMHWGDADFLAAEKAIAKAETGVDSRACEMETLRSFICAKRDFLLSLLGNPNLLEHERFTEMLWAVFHLMEELRFRNELDDLPEPDMDHLSADMRRAYALLLAEWLEHVHHLKKAYPYLYALAVRTNPFDPYAEIEVR